MDWDMDGGLAKFDGVNWTVYNTSNSGLPDNGVRAIAIDGQGNKWIGTYGGGLAKFDGVNWTVYKTSNSGLPNNDVWAITIDGQGNKWIGTGGGGLAVYREGGVILRGPIIISRVGVINFGYSYLNVPKYDTLIVKNIGNESLNISEIRVLGSAFRYEGSLPVVVLAGDSVGLVFSFKPDRLGDYVDTAKIVSNSYVDSVLKISLRGRGVKPPYILSSVDTLKFGNVFVMDSLRLSFNLYNGGDIDTVRIFNVSVGEPFYVDSFPRLIKPGDSARVVVKFKPVSVGRYTREMKIISNAWNDTLKVYVSGVGFACCSEFI